MKLLVIICLMMSSTLFASAEQEMLELVETKKVTPIARGTNMIEITLNFDKENGWKKNPLAYQKLLYSVEAIKNELENIKLFNVLPENMIRRLENFTDDFEVDCDNWKESIQDRYSDHTIVELSCEKVTKKIPHEALRDEPDFYLKTVGVRGIARIITLPEDDFNF